MAEDTRGTGESTAIHVPEGADVQLENVTIQGFDVGLDVESGGKLRTKNVNFQDNGVDIRYREGADLYLVDTFATVLLAAASTAHEDPVARELSRLGDLLQRAPDPATAFETVAKSMMYLQSLEWGAGKLGLEYHEAMQMAQDLLFRLVGA